MFEIDEKQPLLPSFTEVENILTSAEMSVGAAHVHGMLSGYCCVIDNGTTSTMVDLLLAELKPIDPAHNLVADCIWGLWRLTQLQLHQDDYSFECLLPDMDSPLQKRAEALGEWSAGFVIGAAHAGLSENTATEEDVKDALRQFTETALIDFENVSDNEEDERDFMELSEYTRVAAILIHESCVKTNDAPLH